MVICRELWGLRENGVFVVLFIFCYLGRFVEINN